MPEKKTNLWLWYWDLGWRWAGQTEYDNDYAVKTCKCRQLSVNVVSCDTEITKQILLLISGSSEIYIPLVHVFPSVECFAFSSYL